MKSPLGYTASKTLGWRELFQIALASAHLNVWGLRKGWRRDGTHTKDNGSIEWEENATFDNWKDLNADLAAQEL